ncbi:chemotaxis protein CheR [Actinoplanes sp. ATCC 53533]|uniref:methyltransferase domain-containing protein n=1 Tax=Actinoplanes sp. ATCC 53533 TaxID=1288362 RepID=UPI000F766CED|nr:methyltransferase domain-containing protein [Actinoplanes sp. ATCC 53533]RSM48363.1 chemotaxis protein CheR [Actinoplanes sp. ATCC 53533]
MTTDKWASWLLRDRDGGSPGLRSRFAVELAGFRDGVLDRAAIAPGDTVLDVGTGTGLVGLGALDRVGPAGRVVFSDVSAALLDECRRRADPARSSFVRAAADDLSPIPDASVDVVTTRSVLIYVTRKPAAFAELHRVLRPGGRLSIFEPINGFPGRTGRAGLLGLDPAPIAGLVAKVRAAYAALAPAAEVMLDFDERDLVRWAGEAGFTGVRLDYRAEVDVPGPPIADWDAVRRTAPNPLVPTYGEVLDTALTPAERDSFDAYVRSQAQVPTRHTSATAYLGATRA